MKYIRLWILLGVVLVLLSGCTAESRVSDRIGKISDEERIGTRAEITQGDFVYRLVSEKSAYRQGEEVRLYAELEYIGEEASMMIYHAASPFFFPMVEKIRGYEILFGMNQPLLTTTLVRGEPLREAYKRSGGFSAEDEADYVRFMKAFTEEGFQVGHYVVGGYADFYVEAADGEMDTYKIKAQIDFIVSDRK